MCSSVMGRPYSSTFMRFPNSCSTHRLLLMKMAQLCERRVYSRRVRLQMRYVSTFSLCRTEHRSFWCSKVDSSEAVWVGDPTHTSTGRRRPAYWGVWYRALIIHQQYTTVVSRCRPRSPASSMTIMLLRVKAGSAPCVTEARRVRAPWPSPKVCSRAVRAWNSFRASSPPCAARARLVMSRITSQ
uniref:Uncharacterized protein n=1 Tax=Human herpesvirus 2 TaxID=10310 RepID=A0A481TQV4_HHV2|nr:hypothetical protein [Human alphaherpesvirus 2]QBH82891.1 hypothetical protein [Human alphaherpesvirus 2]